MKCFQNWLAKLRASTLALIIIIAKSAFKAHDDRGKKKQRKIEKEIGHKLTFPSLSLALSRDQATLSVSVTVNRLSHRGEYAFDIGAGDCIGTSCCILHRV